MTSKPQPIKIHALVQTQIEARRQRSNVLRMASALCHTFEISEGNHLVCHLTNKPAVKTNAEAVACWIEDQLADPSLDVSQAVITIFVDLLGRKLRSIREDATWY